MLSHSDDGKNLSSWEIGGPTFSPVIPRFFCRKQRPLMRDLLINHHDPSKNAGLNKAGNLWAWVAFGGGLS